MNHYPLFFQVVLYASVAAAAAAIGAVPAALGHPLGQGPLAWGRALAAGLMLGAAYLLIQESVAVTTLGGTGGSLLGIAFIAACQRWTDVDQVEADRQDGPGADDQASLVRRGVLHSGAEGVAIGATFTIHPALGIALAAAFAIHNVPEGADLVTGLSRLGRSLAAGTSITLLIKASQPIAAAGAAALTQTVPAALPWTLGFAAGSMFYLLLVDLLPQAYRHRGAIGIAVVTSVALSAIVLLRHLAVER